MTFILLAVHVASTLFMTGLIWFVQVVHYPLFSRVGSEAFREYETGHTGRTTMVVGPVMLMELASALALLWFRPGFIPGWAAWTGVALLSVIWLSTFFLLVPCHAILVKGFDAGAIGRLSRLNWIRTVAWTMRAVLSLAMLVYWPPYPTGS